MTFTLVIASLFKTCRMSFTATSMFFCGDGHHDKDSEEDSNEDSEEDCDEDGDKDSDEDSAED